MASSLEIAIGKLCPLAQYTNQDGTYERIIWKDERPMPLKADVDRQIARADVPQEVWAGAMIRAMVALDIYAPIKAMLAQSGDELAIALFDRCAAFRRDDPMIATFGALADPPWTERDLDDLFRLAGSFNS